MKRRVFRWRSGRADVGSLLTKTHHDPTLFARGSKGFPSLIERYSRRGTLSVYPAVRASERLSLPSLLARQILGRLRIQYVLSRHGFFMNLNEPLCQNRHGEEAALTKVVDSLRNETFLPLESSWVKRQCGGGNRSSARKPVSCSLAKFGGKMRRKVHPSPYPPVSERSTDSDRMIAGEILLLPPHQCRTAWPAVVSHIRINSGVFPSWYSRANVESAGRMSSGNQRGTRSCKRNCTSSLFRKREQIISPIA